MPKNPENRSSFFRQKDTMSAIAVVIIAIVVGCLQISSATSDHDTAILSRIVLVGLALTATGGVVVVIRAWRASREDHNQNDQK